MCKYKDTNLGIKKLDFGMKRGAMAVFLTDVWTTSISPLKP